MNKKLTRRFRFLSATLAISSTMLAMIPLQAAAYCTDSPVDGAVYKIINAGSDKLLNVANSSSAEGANVNTVANSGASAQRFYLNYQSSSHYWTIEAAHTGMLIDVADASIYNTGNVIQTVSDGGTSQDWEPKLQSDGSYRIVNRNSALSLTVSGSSDGANVYQNADLALSSQRWWLEPVNVACGSSTGSSSSSSSSSSGTSASTGVTGFASMAGSDGLSTTTGGAGGSTVSVTSCSALTSALASSSPLTIQIPDNTTIDCKTSGTAVSACQIACPDYQDPGKYTYRLPTSTLSCSDLGASGTATQYTYAQKLNVASNKTLVGLGSGSTIKGASLVIYNVSNVIVKNLTITDINPHLVEAYDGVTIYNASHVQVDHVEFSMISDGHVDINNSANITISNNHFDGYNNYVCANQHWYTSAVVEGQVTYNHNFWDYTAGRNPKLSGSTTRAHLYNNYWLEVSYFSVGVDDGAQALMEANYFDDAARPHWNIGSGYLNANTSTNVYTAQSATGSYAVQDSGDSVLNDVSMYSYTLENVNNMPNLTSTTGPQ